MKTPIHEEEYPRERLINFGAESLTTYELLAIILNTGTAKENVIELAKRITTKYPLEKLSTLSFSELTNEFGIGNTKACKILSCFELGKRLSVFPYQQQKQIKSAQDIVNILMPQIKNLEKEHLIGIYLNTRSKIVKQKTLFIGSLTESIINSREIFKTAIQENATSVILVHNHPSGDSTPSQSDIESTQSIIEAGKIMGIQVLDHIIIGKDNYWSLQENGII